MMESNINKFEVQHFTLADGWINTWIYIDENDEESICIFDSYEEANSALNDFFEDTKIAIAEGNIPEDCSYSSEEFRIVKLVSF